MCISFGGLSKTAGLSFLQTMSMAMLIYSIPLQVLLISLIKANITLATIVMLTFVINARFFLMSLSIVHHFKQERLIKTLPALLILSASSFTVSHVKFNDKRIDSPFKYYLGVAFAAYITTFIATPIGFYIAFINNDVVLNHIFTIALGIHFTALTAMRWPNIRLIVATVFGFLMMPLFKDIFSINVTILLVPFFTAFIMLLSKREKLTP